MGGGPGHGARLIGSLVRFASVTRAAYTRLLTTGGRDGRGAVRDRDEALHGAVLPAIAVLPGDGPRRGEGVRRVQPHATARLLRRSQRRVRPPAALGGCVGRRR